MKKNMWQQSAIAILFCLAIFVSVDARAQDESSKQEEASGAHWNLKMKTLGGMQFWTDVCHVGGWRIQQNSETEHCRLLNPSNVRYAWGEKAECRDELDRQRAAGAVEPNRGRVVVLLHGLFRTRNSMKTLREHLAKDGKFQVVNFEYSTTRNNIGDSAKALHQVIEGLGEEVTEINFVSHSLGGLVIRHYLHDQTDSVTGQQGDSRIGRTVMMGPPNQGSQMARMFKNNLLFGVIAGKSGRQLSTTWGDVEAKLAIPKHEFGIIAGAQEKDEDFNNYALTGRDDFTVCLSEAKLEGATDLLVKPFFHSTIMSNEESVTAAERFLKHGYFVSAAERHPIVSLKD